MLAATDCLKMCCCLQGFLPSPSTGAEMPSLQFLLLDANWNLTGPLPADWGQNGSMGHLSVLSAHDCNLRGTLPPSWPAQLPNLQVIDLPNNLISGASRAGLRFAKKAGISVPIDLWFCAYMGCFV